MFDSPSVRIPILLKGFLCIKPHPVNFSECPGLGVEDEPTEYVHWTDSCTVTYDDDTKREDGGERG